MKSNYKQKLLKEIEGIPTEMMPKFYRIIHILRTELTPKTKKPKTRGSLKGIWRDSQIDEVLFLKAKKSVFPYEHG